MSEPLWHGPAVILRPEEFGLMQAVIDAARAWAKYVGNVLDESEERALIEAVRALDQREGDQ